MRLNEILIRNLAYSWFMRKMDVKQFLDTVLDLTPPFEVDWIKLNNDLLEVRIYVRYTSNDYESLTGDRHRIYDHAPERDWQHLPWFQYRCLIVCSLPRFIDGEGKVKTVPAPWGPERKGFTHLLATHIVDGLLAVKGQSKVAELFRTTDHIVLSIMEADVERGLDRRGLVHDLRHVSIDEKAYALGHSYATIRMDDERGSVLDMVQDRTEESTRALFLTVTGQKVCTTMERVNLDMWKPFMKVAGEVAPSAMQFHDKFQLFKKLSEAIETTRRGDVKQQPVLKKNRYAVLKNAENRTAEQQEQFQQIDAPNLLTAQAWRIRENFKEIFIEKDTTRLAELFDLWATDALEAGIKTVTKVVNTFQRHIQGTLNAAITKTTSAKHERTNGNIQSVLAKARGSKRFERFRINVLFYFGKLDLSPLRS